MDYNENIVYTLAFKKILNFYLFDCIVPNVSCRKHSLKEYGWNDTRKLEKELFKISNIKKENWKSCTRSDEIEGLVKTLENKSFICIYHKNKATNVESLLYCIRNALAHGSFKKSKINNKSVYYFDNYKNGKLKCHIIISEKTLLDWIKIIIEGETKYEIK